MVSVPNAAVPACFLSIFLSGSRLISDHLSRLYEEADLQLHIHFSGTWIKVSKEAESQLEDYEIQKKDKQPSAL